MRLTQVLAQRRNLRGQYRNPNGTFTAAAIRARSPYAAKNAIVGLGLLSFCGFCYWWAYESFTPDDFEDVPMPPISAEDLEKLQAERK